MKEERDDMDPVLGCIICTVLGFIAGAACAWAIFREVAFFKMLIQ